MRAMVLATLLALAGCEDAGASSSDGMPPSGGAVPCAFGAQAGDPCSMAAGAECFAALTLRQCLSDLKRCHCSSGKLTCEPVPRSLACQQGLLAEGYACASEGHPFCSRAASGGNCTCKARAWSCEYACPAGCPTEAAPQPGASCTLAPDLVCPYPSPAECRCQGGKWACT